MLKIDSVHPMDEYLDLLRTSSNIYIDNHRLEVALRDCKYKTADYRSLVSLYLTIETGGMIRGSSRDDIIEFLLLAGVDLDKRYSNRKTKQYSLDRKHVVEPMIKDGIHVELLENHLKASTFSSHYNFLSTLYSNRLIHRKCSDGNFIIKYGTHIGEEQNLRAYYSDIAVVSIPKIYSSIVCAGDELQHLAWCDYPQADWRFAYNLFIKDGSNIEIMTKYEDAYEGLARLVEGDKFNSETFKTSRKDYKVSCLSTFYYSSNKSPVSNAIRDYFLSCEKYKRYANDLEWLQKFKLPVPCKSYFDHTQLLPEAPYPRSFISKGMNTPIQTFTSHVVNETVFGILERFWNLGYTKDDINIYYVRHDEPIFVFRDSIIKDAWIFEDCSEIFLEGFTPIKLDFYFGDYYKEVNEDLTKRIKQESKKYPEYIHHYSGGQAKDYYPVNKVESVYISFLKFAEYVEIRCLDYRTEKSFFYKEKPKDYLEIFNRIIFDIIRKLGMPRYLLCYSGEIDFPLQNITCDDNDVMVMVIKQYDARAVEINAKNKMGERP